MNDNPWSEIHPPIETVANELRRMRYEMAMAVINERDAFIQDLRETMSHPTRFRDRRKKMLTRRKRVTRRSSMVEFTERQMAIGERILNALGNEIGGNP